MHVSLWRIHQPGLFRIPLVDALISKHPWGFTQGDHCANADEELDGVVYGPKYNRFPKPPFDGTGGLFPKKPSSYAHANTMPGFELDECQKSQCRMMVPNTDYHVLAVSSETGKTRRGQRKVTGRGKAAVPKGVHDKIWRSHIQRMMLDDFHDFDCAVCGSMSGSLLRCDGRDCTRVQCEDCSVMDSQSDPWHCNQCVLELS